MNYYKGKKALQLIKYSHKNAFTFLKCEIIWISSEVEWFTPALANLAQVQLP